MDSTPVIALPKLAFSPMFSFTLALPLFFYAFLFIYVIFTAVMYYHWAAYASDAKTLSVTYIAYLAITIPLLIVMASAAYIA
jgi:hypothetical protein